MLYQQPKIACIGSIYVDINATGLPFKSALRAEEELRGEQYEISLGGSAANFARQLAKFAMPPILIAKIGDDLIGKLIVMMLKKHYVQPALIRSRSSQTNIGINMVNANGKRVMAVFGTANQSLGLEELRQELHQHLNGLSYAYFGGYFKLTRLSSSMPELVSELKDMSIRIILDHGRVMNRVDESELVGLRSVLRKLTQNDYYLPSEKEFLTVTKAQNLDEGFDIFLNLSKATIVVKQSAHGATAISEGKKIHVAGYPTKPRNTVGAGDSFNAGFVKAQIEGLNLEDSLCYANATAALKISRDESVTWQEVTSIVTNGIDGDGFA